MKRTKDKLIQIWNMSGILGERKTHVRLSYAMAGNKKLIETEVLKLEAAQKKSDEYKEYVNKRLRLSVELCDKDSDGKPISANGEFVITDLATFFKETDKLEKKYKKAIDEQKENEKIFNELIKEEVEVEFEPIKFKWLPEDIEGKFVDLMFDFIIFEEESEE